MSEHGIHLFAVAVSDLLGYRLGLPALPAQYGEVEAFEVDDMVALGAPYRGPAINDSEQEQIVARLMVHQQVIEAAARRDYVLPVRLGTVLRDADEVRRLLRAGSELIHQTAARFAGHVEIDIAVTWDLDEVLADVAGDPAVLAAKAAVPAAPPDQRPALILDAGRLVAARLVDRRAEITGVLMAGLRGYVRDFQHNALANDTVVCNTAFLVRDRDVAEFDAALQTVDTDLGGRYNFRRVGPLPLYSFATLDIRELDCDRLEAARESLGLSGDYDQETVDRTFRALAVRLHPDANLGDAAAADRFEQLARARADLVAACRNRSPDNTSGPVRFFSVEPSTAST